MCVRRLEHRVWCRARPCEYERIQVCSREEVLQTRAEVVRHAKAGTRTSNAANKKKEKIRYIPQRGERREKVRSHEKAGIGGEAGSTILMGVTRVRRPTMHCSTTQHTSHDGMPRQIGEHGGIEKEEIDGEKRTPRSRDATPLSGRHTATQRARSTKV